MYIRRHEVSLGVLLGRTYKIANVFEGWRGGFIRQNDDLYRSRQTIDPAVGMDNFLREIKEVPWNVGSF